MPDPRQHRLARPLREKRFRYAVVALLSTVPLFIGLATAWADESVIIDFVRHGQSTDNLAGIISTNPPGPDLTDLGQTQAQTVANVLAPEGPYAGLFASELVRTQETAGYLSDLLNNQTVQMLPGLDEISAGAFDGHPEISLDGLLYLTGPLAWMLGFPLFPMLAPDSTDPNGIVFDDNFSGAVQTMYTDTADSGVVSANNSITDVAFSSEFAMTVWTMMNVNNPDFAVLLKELLSTGQFLPNTGQVVVSGDPGDWTLVSFAGQSVPAASLPTELFVDVRNLIEAPQFAAYNIEQAIDTSDPTTITTAIHNGISEIDTATLNFPVAVIDDILNALGGSSLGDVSTDLTGAALTSF